jgi:sulfatase modifying factor 1
MSSSSDDTILPPQRSAINSSGLDGDTVLPSQNVTGIHVPGDVIDNRYKVIREIGRGGMGVVYEVLDALTDDHYAVKRLLPFFASRPEIVKQFWNEGAASMRFTNQSRLFVTTQTVGQDKGLPYIVMELVSYPTLRAIMNKTGGGLALDDALRLLKAVATSLAELHSIGYIHRDLKPENIFVNEHTGNVTAFLSDFGLIKDGLASTATVMKGAGTERYASPEQKKGLPTTPATDVYAFGVIAYEMLTGELPTYGDDLSDYISDVPIAVIDLIDGCLKTRPQFRFLDGNSLLPLLSTLSSDRTVDLSNPIVYNPLLASEFRTSSIISRRSAQLAKYREFSKYVASMRLIPAGTFQMGSLTGNSDERPAHLDTLSSFAMGETPITVDIWMEYCSATRTAMPSPPEWGWIDDHPVVNVSWNDIMGLDGKGGFCAWASQLVGVALSLPTEAQWEYAARGGAAGQEFPWGNNFERNRLWCSNKKQSDVGKTAPVYRSTQIYRNSYGMTDMAGNVWEWCSDLYVAHSNASNVNDLGSQSTAGRLRSARGGAWYYYNPDFFRCARRGKNNPGSRSSFFGFRLAGEPS